MLATDSTFGSLRCSGLKSKRRPSAAKTPARPIAAQTPITSQRRRSRKSSIGLAQGNPMSSGRLAGGNSFSRAGSRVRFSSSVIAMPAAAISPSSDTPL